MNLFRRLSVLSIVAGLLASTKQVMAQSTIELDLSASSKFGEQITFIANLDSPLSIQSASILIHDSTQVITRIEPVTFNEQGVSEFRFDTQQNLIRPFTTVLWRYELTLADGSKLQSQTASVRYDDDRFAWQAREGNGFRVHWYHGGDGFGMSALNAGSAGMQKIAELFTPDPSSPVDIFIYANESDLRGTLYGAGEAWAAGHADSEAGVVTVTIEAGADQNILMEQRIPHELMHVMLNRQVGVGYKNIPAWLREGVAMLAEVYDWAYARNAESICGENEAHKSSIGINPSRAAASIRNLSYSGFG